MSLISFKGRVYAQEPVYAIPKRRSILDVSVDQAIGAQNATPKITVRHELVECQIMKPVKNPDGSLVRNEAGIPLLVPK